MSDSNDNDMRERILRRKPTKSNTPPLSKHHGSSAVKHPLYLEPVALCSTPVITAAILLGQQACGAVV